MCMILEVREVISLMEQLVFGKLDRLQLTSPRVVWS